VRVCVHVCACVWACMHVYVRACVEGWRRSTVLLCLSHITHLRQECHNSKFGSFE